MSSGLKNVVTILVIVALSSGGAYLYRVYDDHISALSQASLDWPSVDGLIIRSELKTWSSGERRAREGRMKHEVRVSYEYVIDGRSYNNDVVRFDQSRGTKSDKQKLVTLYPVGKLVEVFYNPDNPDESVLTRGSYE